MSDCVPCNTAPSPCNCSPDQTCVQTPRNCSTCPRNICISDPSSQSHHSRPSTLASPIGGAIGGLAAGLVIFLTLYLLYRHHLLPSCFTSIFQSQSTKSFSRKHPLYLNKAHKSTHHHLKSQHEPSHHQSMIYLPPDTKDPNTPSIIDSDDDPFSDKHSGVSIIPKSIQSSTTTVQLSPSPAHPNPPTAHLPPKARSLSIIRCDDNDNISDLRHLASSANHHSPEQQNPSTPTHLRSSFISPSLPSPTHSIPTQQHRPVRPHRAPDLDLRLPGAASSSTPADLKGPTSQQHQPSPGKSVDQSPSAVMSPLSGFHPNTSRRLSGSSDATTHDSHLSSILDPAMIVTPVTLVRTASGRQAAVQRVALRGQEKARVVRLPPSSHPHGPSPLSLSNEAAQSGRSTAPNVRETFGFSPTTPGLGRADEQMSNRSVSGQSSFPSSPQVIQFDHNPYSPELRENLDPFSDLSALGAHQQEEEEDIKDEGTEEIASPRHPQARKTSNLQRSRSAAYSVARSSFGESSVCDSYIEDEEVEFPTVLGRSAATLAQRILQQQQQTPPPAMAVPTITTTTTTHHHVNLKALGRDRAISLSSIITEEAGRESETESPPPLPALLNRDTLPTPFKPFAGQKPSSRGSGRTEAGQSHGSSDSSARLSSVSSFRSGYGSVLEGIPFNIGFLSDPDDLFHRPLSFDAPNGFSDSGHPLIDDDGDDDPPGPTTPTSSTVVPDSPSHPPLPPPPPPANVLLIDPETQAALDYIDQL